MSSLLAHIRVSGFIQSRYLGIFRALYQSIFCFCKVLLRAFAVGLHLYIIILSQSHNRSQAVYIVRET